MSHKFQLKYLCALAIGLTVLSLFIVHNTNPLQVLTTISAPLRSSDIYSRLKTSMQSTSAQCQTANKNKFPDINNGKLKDETMEISKKYAYIQCIDLNIDITEQLYGIIAFQGGLQRTKSKYDHIVLIPQSKREDLNAINSKDKVNEVINLLSSSIKLPSFHVIPFDSTKIDEAFISNAEHSKFRDTFHRAYAFKKIYQLSSYDKLVLIKYNMVILSNNIDILFNYPSPSAPPQRWSGLESNIACFVYSLKDNSIYEKILYHLSNDIYVWFDDDDNKNKEINNNPKKWDKDSWNSERGTFQSLINAIFWNREYGLNGINQIHQKFAVNTNKLSNRRTKYFVEHRPNMLYMIEFVDDYPPTKKARDRCLVRSDKMIKNIKMDWFEIAMNTYFVQFWLDFNIICYNAQYNDICKKINLNYDKEVQVSIKYKQHKGYPFPYIPQQ